MKLLLAEDEVDMSEALVDILTYHKYTVDAVFDGEEALDYATIGEYDGIILDIMMPKIDGYKVLASIRNAERKHGVSRMLRSKVIMTSALDETSFDSNQASDDYDDYICKPIDIMKFNEILKKLDVI